MTSKGNINSLYQFGSGGSKEPEQLIGAYFQAWLTQDESRLAHERAPPEAGGQQQRHAGRRHGDERRRLENNGLPALVDGDRPGQQKRDGNENRRGPGNEKAVLHATG